jgi:flagellar biogenesis protein FliO
LLKTPRPAERASKPEQILLEAAAEPAGKHELTGKLKPPSRRKSISTSSSRSSSTTDTGQWMTTILGLTIVLGLILSVAYAFRKHIPLATKILPPDVIEVLGRRFIDQRNCVQLIRCGNRILIVAHSPTHGLQTLGEITDPVEIDSLAGRCKQSDTASTTSRFEELVAGQFRTKRDKTVTDSGPSLEAEHLPESGLRLPRSPLGGSLRREIPHA